MKEKLKKLLAAKQEQREALNKSMIECESKEERAAIGETLKALATEIAEVEAMLNEVDKPAEDAVDGTRKDDVGEGRSMNVIASMQSRSTEPKKNSDPFDTEEYRTAFMNFCKNGTPIPQNLRADAITKTSDTSAVIPTTILNEIVQQMKVYGNLYAEVRKLNIQGGVQVPILSLKPTATWITADTGTSQSDKQKIQANTSVSFSYYGLECKIAQTLLVNVTTLEMFQQLFVPLATEAIAKALDIAIMNGTGSGQPLGITKDTRVPTGNVVTLNPTDFASWSAWKKKVFAKIPKAYRTGKFYMSQATFDGYIDGMVDQNGQPIGRVNYGIDGAETYRFGGKTVETVEDDVVKAYEDATTGDVVAVFVNPTDYAINSNLTMQTVRWVDNDTNEIKNKVILIADGKLIDPNGVVIVKKGAASAG